MIDIGDWTIGILGCGEAGSRAARGLLELGVRAELITGYDSGQSSSATSWPIGHCKLAFASAVDSIGPHELWFVCTPSWNRTEQYRRILRERPGRVKAIFAEKPLSARIDLGLKGIVSEVEARGIVGQVGYCWRFHPAIDAARSWVAAQNLSFIRASASCLCDRSKWPGYAARTGDSVAELSHELDMLRFLLGSGQVVWTSRDRECIRIEHDSGAESHVILNGRHKLYLRMLRLIGSESAWSWMTTDFLAAGSIELPTPINLDESLWSPNLMYVKEYENFLTAALGLGPARCSWREGLDVVEWIEAIQRWA